MIGAKTLTTLALLVAGGGGGVLAGFLKPERLLGLSAETAFLIGCLATVLGALFYRFCRLLRAQRALLPLRLGRQPVGGRGALPGRRRRRASPSGRTAARPSTSTPGSQLGICLVLALLLCFGTIDARALRLLGGLRQHLQRRGIAATAPTPR